MSSLALLEGGRLKAGLPKLRIKGQTLPPPRRAVQALASFLTAPLVLLSVLCYLHPGLFAADQAHKPDSPVLSPDPFDAAIIDGKNLRDQGHLAGSIAAFARAVQFAQSHGDHLRQAKGLILLAQGKAQHFEYRAALRILADAMALAGQLHDYKLEGIASGTLAEIYAQVGDWPSADAASAQAVAFLRQIQKPNAASLVALARNLESRAQICFALGRSPEGYRNSDESLRLVQSAGDGTLAEMIWDVRGAELTREGNLAAADIALKTALSLSAKNEDQEGIAFIKEHLAELEMKKPLPDLKRALRLIDEALSIHSSLFNAGQPYYPIHMRAKILEASGNKLAALHEYLHAVSIANQWRAGALPGDTSNTLTVAALQELYADYSHLAASQAMINKDKALSISAFEVLAENRAASLREQLRSAYGENGKLPDEYFMKLSELQAAQAQVTLGKNSASDRVKLGRIRLDIADLENKIGIKPEKSVIINERSSGRNSLRDIQCTLARDQVLISISLGKAQSYLWAITGDRVNLSRLPPEADIQANAASFAAAVRTGSDLSVYRLHLSQALFSGLPPDVWNRSEWLLVADGPLLNGIPFAALTNLGGNHINQPLINARSLRMLPSELLLLDRGSRQTRNNFVGVGDPIYNLADSRLNRAASSPYKEVSESLTLARLAGSAREIQSAAKEAHFANPILLTGPMATRENLVAAFSHDASIIHFAVHVVSPPDQPQQAALALSLRDGFPELLTSEVVASFHVPGSLVVLSGCSSGQGKVLPGAGLVGLSRAWLLAGAAAVVVSSWPTPDDSGRFFSSFYTHFDQIKSGDTGQRAALALRRTQVDMLTGSGYQTSPAFWGAFAVVSKE